MSFTSLNLRPELVKAVQAKGYIDPTPIQKMAIPAILKGKDVFAKAQTGTGKTDAFALPIVELLSRSLKREENRSPRALILTPTRELGLQVSETFKSYARLVSMRCTAVFGGIRIEPQIDRLKRGVDILVATPGRLLDLFNRGFVDFSHISFLVFDEADRMLDLGFAAEIAFILDQVPERRSSMLFSATYTDSIRSLSKKMLRHPEGIEVSPLQLTVEAICQKVHKVSKANKRDLVYHLITSHHLKQVLIFTRTRHGANRLCEKLAQYGITALPLHGDKSQHVRLKTLETFKKGEVTALVATDVAARGLDIKHLPCVINFDMPEVPEDYVHRIGRTGRAGMKGTAISLVSPEEGSCLKSIESLLKQKIPVEKVKGFTEESDVPDHVLYRPGSLLSEKKADRDIKELVRIREMKKRKTETQKKQKNSGLKKSPFPSLKKKGEGTKKLGKRPSTSFSRKSGPQKKKK